VVSTIPLAAPAEEPPTGPLVRAAILRSIDALKRRQQPDGAWPDYAQEGGVTALVTYALLQAGVSPDDKGTAAALETLRRIPNQSTYVVSLKALAFVSADPKRYGAEIQAGADRLAFLQGATGAWGYGTPPSSAAGLPAAAAPDPNVDRGRPPRDVEAALRRVWERPDLSNTQFALLALSEADRAGARVSPDVWRKADRYLRTTQLPGGGWGYVYHDAEPEEAYGSMTAAAVASLTLCGDRLARQEPADADADRLKAIDMGITWIADHYTLNENPNRALAYYYFWLYGLERAGVATGRRLFGDHDWFREGTALLVSGQRPDGAWTDRLYHDALCLLFLAKGYKPVLAQRMQWEGQWRRDPRDFDHLVRYLEKRVGGDAVTWQTVPADAPVQDLLAAPLLVVGGRGPLRMIAASLPHLKDYVEQGGLLVFDAEGGDAAFTESVRRIMTEQFPDSTFEPLAADHPIYKSAHQVPPAGLEVLNVGCRAAVLLAPKGLAERWAAEDPARPGEALFLGENLALYATGGAALPDRLRPATLLELPPVEPPAANAWRIGQVQHDGDWNPRPYALPKFLKGLAERYPVPVYSRPVPVRLNEKDLAGLQILYLTGHYAFHLSAEEKAALKAYLDRGGFLVAEACCGRAAFDQALRGLLKELFPDTALALLPADHAIYSGRVGSAIREVAYAPAVRAASPDLNRPVLYGLTRGGHLAVVYSPYGLAVGMDGLKAYGARTYAPDDARRLAENILLSVMLH
jgi:hypothetical protein